MEAESGDPGPQERSLRMSHCLFEADAGLVLLLICSTVIATLELISNSTAVVIGAMIVAPLMDPILSLAFGLDISDSRLVKRSAITVIIGILAVIGTATLFGSVLDASELNREIYSRIAPNLINLGTAVAVAISVPLVPPLCVCGIGLSMGSESLPCSAEAALLDSAIRSQKRHFNSSLPT